MATTCISIYYPLDCKLRDSNNTHSHNISMSWTNTCEFSETELSMLLFGYKDCVYKVYAHHSVYNINPGFESTASTFGIAVSMD